jgi:hypothetical protein
VDAATIRQLLEAYRAGELDEGGFIARLRGLPFEDLGFAKVDHHRTIRCGCAEVIYCPGKTIEQVIGIAEARLAHGNNLLITRASADVMVSISGHFEFAEVNEAAGTVTIRQREPELSHGLIGILAAGTSDIPVAEEARITAEIMDQRVEAAYDVGVAGLHRLLAHRALLDQANVLIVVAGMDGALPSVVGGLVDKPVIAVPTSVGYGASFGGVAALLTMLNSCASAVTVVNIDNGFGAGYTATLINRLADRS